MLYSFLGNIAQMQHKLILDKFLYNSGRMHTKRILNTFLLTGLCQVRDESLI